MAFAAAANSSFRNCEFCQAQNCVRLTNQGEVFEYNYNGKSYKVSAAVSTWLCDKCGTSYVDGDGEEERHDAICDAIGILRPSEIVEIRQRHNLTQAGLSQLTGIGEASIKRWERGASFQSISLDNLLRFLESDAGFAQLEIINSNRGHVSRSPNEFSLKFRLPKSDVQRRQASTFKLRTELRV